MPFSRILCPIDFSEGSQQALRVATRLAEENNAALVVLHSWHLPAVAYSLDLAFPSDVIERMVSEGQRELDASVRGALAAGAKNTTGRLVTGLPSAEIVSVLEKEEFDLCVIGTHGRTGLSRVLLGSVSEKVVRHSPCSVLAVRVDTQLAPFKRVLVPTDYSESARFALELADAVVASDGSIKLMHVIEFPVVYSGVVSTDDFARDLYQGSQAALEVAAATVKSVRVTTDCQVGHPGAQTLATLDDDPLIDIVVMGSHGRSGIERLFLGSVAEKVVRHARCPVLVARRRPDRRGEQ